MKVWIDLDNSPHVPFFAPILRQLRDRGVDIEVSARDCFQTCELLDLAGIEYTKIGRHYGRTRTLKVLGLLIRASQLLRFARRARADVAASHGSRALMLAGRILGIPVVNIFDYEYSRFGLNLEKAITKQLVPAAISDDVLPKKIDLDKVVKYPGFKEEVYVSQFRPDPEFPVKLGLDRSHFIAVIRPPATEANYHDTHSEVLLEGVLKFLMARPRTTLFVLPRTQKQKRQIEEWVSETVAKVVFPDKVLSGLNLIWYSDLVVSGGGTMNREAAFLGVPAYSIFSGKTPAVDQALIQEGKLRVISDVNQIKDLDLKPRPKADRFTYDRGEPSTKIIDEILSAVRPT